MKIKICGVCRPEDAALAARVGADYVGVILAAGGPRQQTVARAVQIFAAGAGAGRAGVFANQPVAFVVSAAERLRLDVVQLHGDEPAEFVAELRRRLHADVWKKITPGSSDDVARAVDTFGDVVHGLLLDSSRGGSGRCFDWENAVGARALLPPNLQLIVAGGLHADNVKEVIHLLRPDIVDVASGVEETIGRKSAERVAAFVRNARS